MKKIGIAMGMALQGIVVFASEPVQMEWEVRGDKYRIENSSYNERNVETFKTITTQFHEADKDGLESILTHFDGELEKYRIFVNEVQEFRANKLNDQKESLLLVKKDEQEIVGGSYYLTEHNGTVVRVTLAGYNLTIGLEAIGLIQAYTLHVLSSRQFFPDAQKLVVFLRKGSSLAPLLYDKFGFIDSEHKFGENEPEAKYSTAFQSYEKPIGQ